MREPSIRSFRQRTVTDKAMTAIPPDHTNAHKASLAASFHPRSVLKVDPHAADQKTDLEGRLTENVLDALPRSIQPLARKMLAEIRDAEDREHARDAAEAFDNEFRAKWPKAADKIRDDLDQLLCFFDFPAEHWVHLKTTNAIESTFATVRLRTKVTKGPGSRAAGLAMAFKLLESAEDRWRAINGPKLVALVRAGAKFKKGVLVESSLQEEEAAA
jgi:putative transposase